MDINNLTIEQKVSILKDILETENVYIEADECSFIANPNSIHYCNAENTITIMED